MLTTRLDELERLTKAAEASPARAPETIRNRLAEQVAALIDAAPALDPDRLHQEAVLLATKADIREEIDRLYAHIAAARELIAGDAAVGRRLDFLAQEFNREVNTLCSKSNDRGADDDRPGDEGGGRPAARAGAERRMMRAARHRPARASCWSSPRPPAPARRR